MFTPFCSADLSTVTTADKRILLKQLKEAIQKDVQLNKANRVTVKREKEAAQKAKVAAQIKAAQEKLAKLQAKLA